MNLNVPGAGFKMATSGVGTVTAPEGKSQEPEKGEHVASLGDEAQDNNQTPDAER